MKHAEVRQTIIETASDLFYQNGYNLTGINEIIREAGIAKATLYNHFKSKDDICLAYLQHKNSQFLLDVKAFVSKYPQGEEQILAIFDFLTAFFKDKAFNGCWCINTVSEVPREKETIKAEIIHQKNQFIALIQSLVGENFPDLSAAEVQFMARQVYLLYEGAVAESHLHQNIWPIESAKDMCKHMIHA